MTNKHINCSGCKINDCYSGEDCVRGYDFEKYIPMSGKAFDNKENKLILEVSTQLEGEHYMQLTRLEEIIVFAKNMGYKKVGIAHCVGLINEANIIKKILDQHFTVYTICCKFSGIDKKDYDLKQIKDDRYEAICNPVGQAMVLNDLKTDLNLIVGLCMGHDILFNKYSEAPVSTFIVKDRITGHNPAAAIYSGYHRKKMGI
ncbi:MAG: DUF1847 domain-containing protein [Bacteroidales bacterium]